MSAEPLPEPLHVFWELLYMLLLWDQQRRAANDRPVKLTVIVPLVFYTGGDAWNFSRDFRELIDGPENLKKHAPQFDILYLGLRDTPAATLEAADPIGWALRAVQRVDADAPEFAAVLDRAARALRPLLGEEWRELMALLVGIVTHRRPAEEAPELERVLSEVVTDQELRAELVHMAKSMAEVVYERGQREGQRTGREVARRSIVRLGTRLFGPPSAEQLARIEGIHEFADLEALSAALVAASGWDELLSDRT